MYKPHVMAFDAKLGFNVYHAGRKWFVRDGNNDVVGSHYIHGHENTHIIEINDACKSSVDESFIIKSNNNLLFFITKKDYEYYIHRFYERSKKYDYVHKDFTLYMLPKSLRQMWFETDMIERDNKKNCFHLLKYFQENDIIIDVFSYIMDLFYLLIKSDLNRCFPYRS